MHACMRVCLRVLVCLCVRVFMFVSGPESVSVFVFVVVSVPESVDIFVRVYI